MERIRHCSSTLPQNRETFNATHKPRYFLLPARILRSPRVYNNYLAIRTTASTTIRIIYPCHNYQQRTSSLICDWFWHPALHPLSYECNLSAACTGSQPYSTLHLGSIIPQRARVRGSVTGKTTLCLAVPWTFFPARKKNAFGLLMEYCF